MVISGAFYSHNSSSHLSRSLQLANKMDFLVKKVSYPFKVWNKLENYVWLIHIYLSEAEKVANIPSSSQQINARPWF